MGWYTEPVVTMYAPDEKTRVTLESEIEEYKTMGWYTEPVVTMYAPDERTLVIPKTEIEAYKAVGWYTDPVVTMYAPDERTLVIPKTEIEAYKAVGWYSDPVVIMYAPDGRTRVTLTAEVEAYKGVGWYIEPVVIMYAPDGRTRVTLKSEVEAYKGVGWYTEPVVVMYAADGRTRVTLKSEVEAYKRVGWYTAPVVVMYAADGRSSVILKSEVEAYKKSGWTTQKPVKSESVKDESITTFPTMFLKYTATNKDFLSFANKNYPTLSLIRGYISMGAYFHVNYDISISDKNAPNNMGKWWLVDDEKASTMAELKSFWYSYFSRSSDISKYTTMYKEFNGKLYSACPGVGASGAGEPNYTKVKKISNDRIEIIGTIDLYDINGTYFDTRTSTLVMVAENNVWVCEELR